MLNKHKVLSRIRRHHFEFEDDLSAILAPPHVRKMHPHEEIAVLLQFNNAVRRVNECYAARHPNNADISLALRKALKYANDITQHRVANFMPQGVEDVKPWSKNMDLPQIDYDMDRRYEGVESADNMTKPKAKNKEDDKDCIQMQNPITKMYIKISKNTGKILEEKKKEGPYKGIEIYKGKGS